MDNEEAQIRGSIRSICAFIVPFLSKWLTVLSRNAYGVLLGIGVVAFGILIVLISLKKAPRGWLMPSIAFCASIGICLYAYPVINKPVEQQLFNINLSDADLKREEKAAAAGDVLAMEKLGGYYCSYNQEDWIPRTDKSLRAYDIIDTRDFGKARKYLRMAAEKDSAFGYGLLGLLDMYGMGSIPSRKSAIINFENALRHDNHSSQVYEAMQLFSITEEEFPLGYKCFPELKQNKNETQ